MKLDFKDVLIIPKRSTLSSRSEVKLEKTYTFLNSKNSWTGLPIMVSNMDTTGNFEVAKVMAPKKIITCIGKHFGIEKWEEFAKENSHLFQHIAVSSGTTEVDFSRLKEILARFDIGFICIDVANGYTENFISFVAKTRKNFPHKNIIAGNVVTSEMVEQLLICGADIVKIGIGSGSVCTTRLKTGVGYPQLSAVIECADAAHGLNGHIVSDGGCSVPGDVSKAFGGGADFVMLGGMFAGHDESGGEVVEVEGKKFKKFYGMASRESLEKYYKGDNKYRTHEGKVVFLPYRGPIDDAVMDLLGGVRSTCTYVGAKTLKELPKRTTFVRCSMQANSVYTQFDFKG